MALKWTKTSGPLSWVMNPKPFSALNHFTVPTAMSNSLLSVARPASLRSVASGTHDAGQRELLEALQRCRTLRAAHSRTAAGTPPRRTGRLPGHGVQLRFAGKDR